MLCGAALEVVCRAYLEDIAALFVDVVTYIEIFFFDGVSLLFGARRGL